MNKIYIIGSVASGKTTLAKKLSNELHIQHYELDNIIFDDKNNKRSPEEQVKLVHEINKNSAWIIEGTYRKSCHIILDISDKIIFLDTPLFIRKSRILTRFIKQKLHIEKCNYKVDLSLLNSMYKWTNSFEEKRTDLIQTLSNYTKKLVVIKNAKKIHTFLDKKNVDG